MRVFVWLLRAFLFFALFAFALNNRDAVIVHWFFGVDWSAPLVIVVLVAFGIGCACGVLAMVPGRWRRHASASQRQTQAAPPAAHAPTTVVPSDFGPDYPPRVGL